MAGLIYSFTYYSILFLYRLNQFNYQIFFTNILFTVVTAYGLWEFDLWSAGDAKLYIVFSLLLPIELYRKVYLTFFPSFNLLINIFKPAALFFLISAIIAVTKKGALKKLILKMLDNFNKAKRNLTGIFLGFLLIFLLMQLIREKISGFFYHFISDENLILILCFALSKPLAGLIKNNKKFFAISLCLLIFYVTLNPNSFFWVDLSGIVKSLKMAIIVMMLFYGYRLVTELYIESSEAKITPFAIWMFFGALITWFFS